MIEMKTRKNDLTALIVEIEPTFYRLILRQPGLEDQAVHPPVFEMGRPRCDDVGVLLRHDGKQGTFQVLPCCGQEHQHKGLGYPYSIQRQAQR